MEDYEDIAEMRWKETEKTPKEIIENFQGGSQILGEKVLTMNPGRELNILVAKYVMGNEVISDEMFEDMERLVDTNGDSVWANLQPYSEDLTAAQMVVTIMIESGHGDALSWQNFGNGKYTPAEAICKRALIEKVLVE